MSAPARRVAADAALAFSGAECVLAYGGSGRKHGQKAGLRCGQAPVNLSPLAFPSLNLSPRIRKAMVSRRMFGSEIARD
jgi:hypothetical protein